MDKSREKRKKILILLVIILLLSFLADITVVLFVFRNESFTQNIINNSNLSQEEPKDLHDDFLRQCSAVWYLLSLDNQDEIADAGERIAHYDAKLEESFTMLKIFVKNEEEINALSAAAAKFEEYKKVRDEVISCDINADRQKALALMKEAFVPAANELDEMLMPLSRQFSPSLEDAAASMKQNSRICIFTMIGISILSIAALVLACFAAVQQ